VLIILEHSIAYPRNYNICIPDKNGETPNDILKLNPNRKVMEERFNAKKLKKQFAYGVINLFDSEYQFRDFFQDTLDALPYVGADAQINPSPRSEHV
jgi:hypothetical protein